MECVDAVELSAENAWIEKALEDPNSVEHRIYLSNAPRKDLITRWATNLEFLHQMGEYDKELNTISTYISNKFRSWKMESAVHYVRHVLDHKYKNETFDRTEDEFGGTFNRQDSSNLLSFEAKQSNANLISFLDQTIISLKNITERLKKDVILESKIPDNELEIMYLNWTHCLKRLQESFDGREKVLSTHQHLMAYALSNYSLNHAYIQYLKYAKEDTKLTEKQASKMSRLQINKIDTLFDPKNFMEAKELGFYGTACSICGSWRTEKRWNQDASKNELYCFDIHTDKDKSQWSTLKTMKLEEVLIEN